MYRILFRIGRGYLVGGAQHAFNNISDVGEIANMLSAIEELNRLARQNILRKYKQWSAP